MMFETIKKYRPKDMNKLTDLETIAVDRLHDNFLLMKDHYSLNSDTSTEDTMYEIARAFRVHLSEIEIGYKKTYTIQGKPMSEIKLTPSRFEEMFNTCPNSLDKQLADELWELTNKNSKTS